MALMVKNPPASAEDIDSWVQSLDWGGSLEEGMAPHASILAWRIPWTERSLAGCSPWDHKESDMTGVT